MPARVFKHGVPPQRIRTFLILFAVALAAPLLGLAFYGLNRMASLEQAEIERRVLQVAGDLAHDIDRELDRATAILDTLASLIVHQAWTRPGPPGRPAARPPAFVRAAGVAAFRCRSV